MAVLADAIKAVDPAPDKKSELTLAVSLLSELSESKVNQFKGEVLESYRTAGTPENRTAPIELVVASHSEYRAYVKDDAGKVVTEVQSAIKDFVTGGSEAIIDGMAKLVTTGLQAILGGGEATQQEMRTYYLTVESRALVRYDIMAWRRRVEATGITQKIEDCIAIYASKASVKVSALDLNTFLLAYGDQLARMGFSEKETLEYLDYAEKVYERLRGNEPSNRFETDGAFVQNLNRTLPLRPGEHAFYPPLQKN